VGVHHRGNLGGRASSGGEIGCIGEEERKIRKDPVGTGSAILRKVFGIVLLAIAVKLFQTNINI
jgi:hypothetical protein